jgi:hypothetical protein
LAPSDRGNPVVRSDGGPREETAMSEPMSEQRADRDEVTQDVAAAGATDEPAGNLTVEDDPQGTTDPADLAGTGGRGDDGVE